MASLSIEQAALAQELEEGILRLRHHGLHARQYAGECFRQDLWHRLQHLRSGRGAIEGGQYAHVLGVEMARIDGRNILHPRTAARRMRSNSRRRSTSVAGSIFGRCVRKALSMPGQAASTACALSVAKPWGNSSANRACAAAMLSGEGCCSCARSAPGGQFAAASVTATARMRSGRMWLSGTKPES